MDLLNTRSLTHYRDGTPLLAGVDLRLTSGTRLGVVGGNGSGKSTLLALLAGVRQPDEGRVLRSPGARVGYLPQAGGPVDARATVWGAAAQALAEVRAAEAQLRAEERRIAAGDDRTEAHAQVLRHFEALGGYGAEAALREVLAAVGFDEPSYDRPVGHLSGGERRRLALASVLAAAPDVLLLDEPTNHLDLSMRRWLAERLRVPRGALVLVSHDRALLDAATDHTLFLAGGRVELRRGAYGVAKRAQQRDLLALQRRDTARRKEARRLERMAEELARFGHRGAQRRRHAARREAKRLAGTREGNASADQRGARMAFDGRSIRGVVLEAEGLSVAGRITLPRMRLYAGEKIALLGANGSGKSTVLRLLAGDLPGDDPRGWRRYAPRLRLAQVGQLDRGLAAGASLLEQLERHARAERARALLADVGLGPEAWSRTPEELSGGERMRAGLALLMAREADVLLLDEPTNDLDLEAVEALESALRVTPAAVVLATHDHRLADRVADRVWGVAHGRLQHYGDVAGFLAGRPSRATRAAPGAGEQPPEPDRPSAPAAGATPEGAPDGAPSAAPDAASDAALHAAPGAHRSGPPGATPDTPAGAAAAPDTGVGPLDAYEAERARLLRALDDPDTSERERARARARIEALEDAMLAWWDARLPPPVPRFTLRERGLRVDADRRDGGLVVRLVPPHQGAAARARAMARLLADAGDPAATAASSYPEGASSDAAYPDGAYPDGAYPDGAHPHGGYPDAAHPDGDAWLAVRPVQGVLHARLHEPGTACLLPWARTALVDGAARHALALLPGAVLQLHCRRPLPGTRWRDGGGGWWVYARADLARDEGWGEAEARAALGSPLAEHRDAPAIAGAAVAPGRRRARHRTRRRRRDRGRR